LAAIQLHLYQQRVLPCLARSVGGSSNWNWDPLWEDPLCQLSKKLFDFCAQLAGSDAQRGV